MHILSETSRTVDEYLQLLNLTVPGCTPERVDLSTPLEQPWWCLPVPATQRHRERAATRPTSVPTRHASSIPSTAEDQG